MRKHMTKLVTQTVVQCAKMETKDGKPVAVPMDDVILLGNVSLKKAQREIKKEYGENVVALSAKAKTIKYKMALEDFISVATPIEDSGKV